MLLTLDQTEKILIEQGLTTREYIDERKELDFFGRSQCTILRIFKKAVRRDFRPFFPREPCWKRFDEKATYLFKDGGSRDFPAKKFEGEINVSLCATKVL